MGYAGFAPIGYIQRTHGINGELMVSFSSSVEFNPKKLESVFLDIEGIPVPFFIAQIQYQDPEKAIVKFDDVDTIEQAQELSGTTILIPSESTHSSGEIYLDDLIGYRVISTDKSEVGVIVDYTEYSMNAIFEVATPEGKQILIPATDELIVEVDTLGKLVEMEIPEGLLGLDL